MQELASQLKRSAPRVLGFADCHAAAQAIEAAGSSQFPAFADLKVLQGEVAPASLHQAFLQVMHDNNLAVPVLRQVAGAEA